jgi:lysophospholipase L1-like esterase/uncharacterized protein YjdB
MKRNLLPLVLGLLTFSTGKSYGQNILHGENMEDATKWTVINVQKDAGTTQSMEFNYTKSLPTGGSGGCLHLTGSGTVGGVINTAIYQQVSLKKRIEYKVDLLFKDLSSNLNNLWFQTYITSSEPLAGHDITSTLLKGFNTWNGCGIKADGLLSQLGCEGPGVNFNLGKTTGDTTVWLAVKFGSGWTTNPYDLIIDNFTLEPAKLESLTLSSVRSKVGINQTLQISPEFVPAHTLDQSLEWSVTDGTGKATIDGNGLLTGVSVGSVTVKATAKDGSNVSSQKVIEVVQQVILAESVEVKGEGGSTTISVNKGTLQMQANVLPAEASSPEVVWSVTNGTGKATIDAKGLLTANSNGIVTVKATTTDGTNLLGQLVISISNQVAPTVYKIYPLGDSKTEGGLSASDQYSWRGILRAKLTENKYSIDYLGSQKRRAYGDVVPFDDDNEGHGGYTIGPDTYKFCETCETTGIYEHIDSWLNASGYPDIVIMSIGINDLLGDGVGHPANYKKTSVQRYKDLLKKVMELRPNAKIVLCTVEPVRWDKNWGAKGTDLGNLNDAIRELANASVTDDVYLADLYTDFMNTWDNAYFFDEVHMSKLGATRTATTIYNALVPLMQKTTGVSELNISPNSTGITIYPNPVDRGQSLKVKLENFKRKVSVNLYNSTGQIVFNKEVHNSDEIVISTQIFGKGVYILICNDGVNKMSEKVILE